MRLTRRIGATLTELVIALALFGVVATLLLHLVRAHQRFQTGTLQVVETRQSLHGAADLITAQLHAVASRDILGRSDSAITYRAPLGIAIVCAIDSSRTRVTFASRSHPPVAILGGGALPRSGDSLLVLILAAPDSGESDLWRPVAITSDPVTSACPLAPIGIAQTLGAAAAGWMVRVSEALPSGVDPGAPAWPYYIATLSHYRASSGEWMLGYQSCAGGSCNVRQPISGPYRSAGAGGLAFRLVDSAGVDLPAMGQAVRLEMMARAESRTPVHLAHLAGARFRDSLALSLAIRNRP